MWLWISLSCFILISGLEIYKWYRYEEERYSKLLKDYDKLDRKFDCCHDELEKACRKIRDLKYTIELLKRGN